VERCGRAEIASRHDVVAVEHGARFVAGELPWTSRSNSGCVPQLFVGLRPDVLSGV